MIKKIVYDVATNESQISECTAEELLQKEMDYQRQLEEEALNALIPSREEVEQAEFELKTITLLMEVGLL